MQTVQQAYTCNKNIHTEFRCTASIEQPWKVILFERASYRHFPAGEILSNMKNSANCQPKQNIKKQSKATVCIYRCNCSEPIL